MTFADDVAQTLAWERAREEPTEQDRKDEEDRKDAEEIVARIQAKRAAAGLKPIQ